MSTRDLPPFRDLREFLTYLVSRSDLARVGEPVSVVHEITAIHRRVLKAAGPALHFERPVQASGRQSDIPTVVNLFGTVDRVAAGLGVRRDRLAEVGEALAALRAPEAPKGLRDTLARWPVLRSALNTRPQVVGQAPVQAVCRRPPGATLEELPIQTCWPEEPAPLVTWPLVLTRPPDADPRDAHRINAGVYRLQVAGPDQLIMRWLAHRGGAAHHRAWAARGRKMPVAIAIGADPATMLAAALPLPETLSELAFAGILRNERPRLTPARTVPLLVPADAEIVIEGWVASDETAPEGPYGDHTGYYNAVERFPLMRVAAITSRRDPIYVSTFTGRPPDEPSIIGEALNELGKPLVRQQLPEVTNIHFPPDACSYRLAIVAIRKRYPGQARRVMMGLWGMLPQFSYTKIIVVVDDDIDVESRADLLWALSTRMDPSRDLLVLDRTPIDYLDFASPEPGLGGKLGIDATNKIGSETRRDWGRPIEMGQEVEARIDALWPRLGIDGGGAPDLR